ncbi:hypothetical protein [Hydrogenophaga sp. NFH-34]|uniref:hypothetical protein n=1 Tax=Hydrogenophaga sp. NFH-34 TaxID=2744446 RepID=UPI001F391C78|nr:hypothetical protein [Hydrogenophaga sp. NFH-34]
MSEATEEIARLEAQETARTAERSSLRDERKAQELLAAGRKERAALAARLESELRDARAALAKSEQQVADLAKAGEVQKLLEGLGARLTPADAAAKGKRYAPPQRRSDTRRRQAPDTRRHGWRFSATTRTGELEFRHRGATPPVSTPAKRLEVLAQHAEVHIVTALQLVNKR